MPASYLCRTQGRTEGNISNKIKSGLKRKIGPMGRGIVKLALYIARKSSCTCVSVFLCLCLGILLGHVLDEVNHTRRVAPLVVIPAHHLHEGRVQHDASLGIEGARDGASLKVGGHKRLIRVAKEALHVSISSLLHLSTDLLVSGLLLQLHSEIHHGDINGWDTEGHASELALDLWDHLGDGLCSTSAARNDVASPTMKNTNEKKLSQAITLHRTTIDD